jgi:signal transduction histidine kinase
VILNILKNAQDTLMKIEDDREKTITIKIQDSGKYVLISIKDNADGISEDILPKIFDPYFTTKHQSQGTGLGLYTTRNDIEQQLNGKIKVNNSTNGAEFIIVLPK